MIIIEGVSLSVFKRDLKNIVHNKPYLKTLYRAVAPFLLGCAITQLTTDICKYSLGRLRPHFITLCNPTVPANCSALTGYIENDVCTTTDTKALQEARSVYCIQGQIQDLSIGEGGVN